MAGRGPAPASGHTRPENDRQLTRVAADGKLRGPALPKSPLVDDDGQPRDWHSQTKKWWTSWRKSPQALQMQTDLDWAFLLDTALMHDDLWTNRNFKVAAEIRLRLQKFGATPEDRARIGIEVSRHAPSAGPTAAAVPAVATVTSMADRRQRLTAPAT